MEGKLMEYAQERLAKYDASPEEHPQVYLSIEWLIDCLIDPSIYLYFYNELIVEAFK